MATNLTAARVIDAVLPDMRDARYGHIVVASFLRLRPQIPDDAARTGMLSPEDVASAVRSVADVPACVRIDELVISPMSQT